MFLLLSLSMLLLLFSASLLSDRVASLLAFEALLLRSNTCSSSEEQLLQLLKKMLKLLTLLLWVLLTLLLKSLLLNAFLFFGDTSILLGETHELLSVTMGLFRVAQLLHSAP